MFPPRRSHPNFSHEDYLATNLQLRFKDYQSRIASPVLHDLGQKLRRFYATYVSSKNKDDSSESTKPSDQERTAVFQTLLALAQEVHDIRMLGKQVYDVWKAVKKERQRTGFQFTGVKVTAKRLVCFFLSGCGGDGDLRFQADVITFWSCFWFC